jgi:hypothetical protein
MSHLLEISTPQYQTRKQNRNGVSRTPVIKITQIKCLVVCPCLPFGDMRGLVAFLVITEKKLLRCRLLCRDPNRLLGLEGRRDLILIVVIEIQQLKAVRSRRRLLWRWHLSLRPLHHRGIRLCALVDIPVDLGAFVLPAFKSAALLLPFLKDRLQSAHHASLGINGVVD